MKYILYRDWLGGWHLPQTKSYFVLRLPHEWFVFGFDNGLDNDIDPQQAAYFANYSKTLPEAAKVILIQHDPNWVLDLGGRNLDSGDPWETLKSIAEIITKMSTFPQDPLLHGRLLN